MEKGESLIPLGAKSVHTEHGVIDLWKAIMPLTTIASAMNTGAHPDDEHSAMLAYLSLGRGVYTTSIIATRGEGGQNEIGSELGHALGIIRTRELEEASVVNNVTLGILSEQIDDPIIDFGFSKCAQETFRKWGEAVVYERLVRKIRELRPDVVIPAFLNEPTTHGHHRAITILTIRAFHDAANPAVFPEHLQRGLQPWQVKKLYVPAADDDFDTAVPVGEYNQTYGASYLQLGEESRFMHMSQGMGVHYDEGPTYNHYKLELSTLPADQAGGDFFDGIAFTFADLADEIAQQPGAGQVAAELRALEQASADVIAAFPSFASVARRVHEMIALVQKAIADVTSSALAETTKSDLLFRLNVKEKQLYRASMEAASLIVKLKPETGELIAGQKTTMTVTAYNGGTIEVTDVNLHLIVPDGWKAEPTGATCFPVLGYNQRVVTTYELEIPTDAELFHPYRPAVVHVQVDYQLDGVTSKLDINPECQVAVLPPYSLTLLPSATVVNTLKTDEAIPVRATVKNYTPGAADAAVALQVPEGWSVEPEEATVSFDFKAETKSVAFTVRPAAQVKNGKYTIAASIRDGSRVSREDVQVIEYPHIGRTYYLKPADLHIQAFDLQVPDKLKVGYVSSGFDNIDEYLREVGVDVVQLDAKELQCGDLSAYQTIVLGIRAYAFRPELIPCNQRLLSYVQNGGNLVVQYHKPEDKWSPALAPYPITIGTPLIDWRVTDEHSPVAMLAPGHPLFCFPNRITDADWEHWVHERSAYNPSRWSSEYTELIATSDEGEAAFRGIFLTAAYGKGTYTYSSLSWYREIPSLVPGAIRMFVNMISLKQQP